MMDKEELESQLIFNKIRKQQHLIEEFEKLKPSSKGSTLTFISMAACIGFMLWLFPEFAEEPVLYSLLILIFSVGMGSHIESRKINERIDTLYRLLKSDV